MDLSREFTEQAGDKVIKFHVTYDMKTHHFAVVEDDSRTYTLKYDIPTRRWSTEDGSEPGIAIDKLALLVQQSFGVFV